MATSGWVGFDLDGTLAIYPSGKGHDVIGVPIEKMAKRVRDFLADGVTVKILTARAAQGDPGEISLVQDWTQKHFGVRLPVTAMKDYGMIEMYDDRCKQVIPNKGVLLEDVLLGKEIL